MRPRPARFLLPGLLALAAIGLVALVVLRPLPAGDGPAGAPPDSQVALMQAAPAAPATVLSSWRVCERVIDGDTIVLDGGEHVRLIGVDTPEKNDQREEVRRLARQATSFTRAQVAGRRVRLEYDQTHRDRYRRTLAYVYLEGGAMLNAEIIRQGAVHRFEQEILFLRLLFTAHGKIGRTQLVPGKCVAGFQGKGALKGID